MTRNTIKAALLGTAGWGLPVAVVLAFAAATPTYAQDIIKPPESYNPTDERGVNLATGSLSISSAEISVGQAGQGGQGGLNYSASYDSQARGWRHSVWGGVQRDPADPNAPLPGYTVTVMGRSVTFEKVGSAFAPVDGHGKLTLSGGIYTFTDLDGTVATFTQANKSLYGHEANEGVIDLIVRPDGERISFTYEVVSSGPTVQRHPKSVNSSLGYQLFFTYPNSDRLGNWTVTAVNNGVDYCAPAATSCTTTQTWPSLTFARTAVNGSYSVTDNLNRQMRFTVSSQGPSAIFRPTATGTTPSLSVSYAAGADNRVSSVSDGAGAWTYSIPVKPTQGGDRTSTVTDPNSQVTSYEFRWQALDINRLLPSLLAITNGDNERTQINQNGGGLNAIIYPEGNAIVVNRNARGDVESIVRTDKAGTTSTSVTATYPTSCTNEILCGRPTAITDARGNVTDYSWSATHGGLLSETLPTAPNGVRPQTRHSYAQFNAWYRTSAATTQVQNANAVWRRTRTSACATAAGAACVNGADEVYTATSYETGNASTRSNLLPTTVTTGSGDNALLATTTTAYDVFSNILRVTGPLGSADVTRYVYDAMRQPVGEIGPDPDGAGGRAYPATRTRYNADGQVDQVQQGTTAGQSDSNWAAFSPLQTATTLYDLQGRKVRDTAFEGSTHPLVTSYSYDGEGRLTCTATRMNPATFASLPASACTAVSTPGAFGRDRITSNLYDAADRLTQVSQGDGASALRTLMAQDWTSNGKVAWMEDGQGNRSTFVYDGFDRVLRLNYPSATVGAHAPNLSDYEEYGYDANDNPTTKRTRSNGLFTTNFDALNRISAIDAPVGSNDVWYGYDNLNRRLYASHASGTPSCGTVTAVCMSWDALGRQLTDQQALGTMTMVYDLAGRRTNLFYPDGFEIRYSYDLDDSLRTVTQAGLTTIATYGYDDLGRRTSVVRGNGAATSYTYDGASRLRTLGHDLAGTASDVTWTFSYNPASQVFVRQTSNPVYLYAPTAGSQTITRNGLNQPTAVNSAAASSDARGNLTSDGVRSFVYDSANRLTGTGSSTLSYDPLDRMTQMVGTLGARYLYDGDEIAGVVAASTGTTIANRIVRGPWPDELLVAYQGNTASTPLWSLQDHQASIIAITDAAGTAPYTLGYDEYGQPRAGNAGRLMYTGQLWLPDWGLYHYKARAYHPGLGRFVQTDPVGYAQGMNLYAYVGLDPVNATDPGGMIACPEDRPNCESPVLPLPDNDPPTTLPPIIVTMRYRIAVTYEGHPIHPPIPIMLPNPQLLVDPIGTIGRYYASRDDGRASGPTPPAEATFWKSLDRYRGRTRRSGEGRSTRFYQYDRRHGEVEVYNSRREHIGVADARSGDIIKPAVRGRKIESW